MRLKRFVDGESPAPIGGGNLCGVLLHARPDAIETVRTTLSTTAGVEIHHTEPDGRMVLTVEDAAGRWAGQIITSLYDIPGVASASLVYHHSEETE